MELKLKLTHNNMCCRLDCVKIKRRVYICSRSFSTVVY